MFFTKHLHDTEIACRTVWTKDMIDYHSYTNNVRSCEIKALKKSCLNDVGCFEGLEKLICFENLEKAKEHIQ